MKLFSAALLAALGLSSVQAATLVERSPEDSRRFGSVYQESRFDSENKENVSTLAAQKKTEEEAERKFGQFSSPQAYYTSLLAGGTLPVSHEIEKKIKKGKKNKEKTVTRHVLYTVEEISKLSPEQQGKLADAYIAAIKFLNEKGSLSKKGNIQITHAVFKENKEGVRRHLRAVGYTGKIEWNRVNKFLKQKQSSVRDVLKDFVESSKYYNSEKGLEKQLEGVEKKKEGLSMLGDLLKSQDLGNVMASAKTDILRLDTAEELARRVSKMKWKKLQEEGARDLLDGLAMVVIDDKALLNNVLDCSEVQKKLFVEARGGTDKDREADQKVVVRNTINLINRAYGYPVELDSLVDSKRLPSQEQMKEFYKGIDKSRKALAESERQFKEAVLKELAEKQKKKPSEFNYQDLSSLALTVIAEKTDEKLMKVLDELDENKNNLEKELEKKQKEKSKTSKK